MIDQVAKEILKNIFIFIGHDPENTKITPQMIHERFGNMGPLDPMGDPHVSYQEILSGIVEYGIRLSVKIFGKENESDAEKYLTKIVLIALEERPYSKMFLELVEEERNGWPKSKDPSDPKLHIVR